jgi:hypothetical protein
MLKIINCKALKYVINKFSLFVSLNTLKCREPRDVATVCRVQVPREAISGYVQTRGSVDTTLARGDFYFPGRM